MSKQVNVGVISTSRWTATAFLPYLQHDERVNLKAICGRNQERAREVAEQFGAEKIYADYRDMIANAELDAIIVASPDDLHYEMVMAALDAGLHVLCEKPTAMNANDAKTILDKAEEKGVKHMVMYTWHWLPIFQKAKRYIEDGFVGAMYHASFDWQMPFRRSREYVWRTDGNRTKGIVADLGSHLFHLASWLMGDIIAVTARLGFYGEFDVPDAETFVASNDTAFVILEFASGAMAQVTVSSVSNMLQSEKGTRAEIHGKDGSLGAGFKMMETPDIGFELTFNARKDAAEEQEYEQDTVDMFELFNNNSIGVRYFIDCIVNDSEPVPSLKEGYQIQKVIDAALLSHETGKRIEINT